MNWYSVFYWLTVADSVSGVCGTLSVIFAIIAFISLIGYFVSTNYLSEKSNKGKEEDQSYVYNEWLVWTKAYKRVFTVAVPTFLICTLLNVFIPSKKDALIIIAGGSVGNFITKDTSARQIPSEVMNMLRAKIQSEINKASITSVKDTLAEKSKEELIEMLKQKTD